MTFWCIQRNGWKWMGKLKQNIGCLKPGDQIARGLWNIVTSKKVQKYFKVRLLYSFGVSTVCFEIEIMHVQLVTAPSFHFPLYPSAFSKRFPSRPLVRWMTGPPTKNICCDGLLLLCFKNHNFCGSIIDHHCPTDNDSILKITWICQSWPKDASLVVLILKKWTAWEGTQNISVSKKCFQPETLDHYPLHAQPFPSSSKPLQT